MAAIFQIKRGTADISSSIVDGELYLNKTKNSLQVANGDSNPITLAKLDELNTGSLSLSGNLTASNAYFTNNVRIDGNIILGDGAAGDTIQSLGVFTTDLNAGTTNTYNIGSTGSVWKNVYATNFTGSLSGSINGIGNVEAFSASLDLRLDRVEASSSLYDNAMSGSKRLYVSPSGSDSNDGQDPSTPFRTIKAAVEYLGAAEYTNTKRYTIFVGSGEYTEQNPIAVPPGVSIVGDTLRTVRLTAANPTKDYFHCHDGNYFYGLRFLNLQNPSFCFSYPCSTATATISGGGVSGLTMIHTESGYANGESVNVIIEKPDVDGGVAATATAVVSGGVLSINMVSNGSGYVAGEKPHVSIQAPLSKRPIIGTSPYIQNCSSITGPFTTDGTLLSLVPGNANYAPLPYNVNDVRNASNVVIGSGVIDEQGAGGGIRIDGNLVHPLSPLESFVADAFTQVNQGGPGHLVINNGYAQFVSCFTTFCTYGFKTANGGFANVSNSVIDFGKYGLISKTYFPTSYNTATSSVNLASYLASIQLDENGAGYTGSFAGVQIFGGGASIDAIATASVDANGSIREIVITNSGSGYTSKPTVVIDTPTGPGAIPATTIFNKGEISNIGQIPVKVTSISRGIDISSNMILDGQNYLVVDVSGSGQDRLVSILNTEFHPAPASITSGSILNFHQLSNISTGNIVMEYVGSGITYNALPKFGGIPLRTREVNEFAPGRVFYTSVDNIGNLKIGDYFSVNQLTGEVSITSDSFNLTGLNAIGPFRRNGFDAGVILQEVSNNTTLLNSVGLYGEDTVPTQFAVKGYIDPISASLDGRLDKIEIFTASISGTNEFTSSTKSRLSNLESTSASVNEHISDINTYTASLKTALDVTGGNTRIKGNLIVDGTQTSLNTTETFIEDMSITLASGSTTSGIADGAGFNIAGANVSMSWDDANTRLYFNTNIAALGSISSSTIVGLNDVSVTTYSTSVDSRIVSLSNTSTASTNRLSRIEESTSSLNTFSASVLGHITDINTKTGSFENKFITLQTLTASVQSQISRIQESTASLNTYTGSSDVKWNSIRTTTASLSASLHEHDLYTASVAGTNQFTASTLTRFARIEESTSSLNTFSASVNEHIADINSKTGSFETRFTRIEESTASLNTFSASVNDHITNINTWTGSTFNTFSQSVDDRLDDVEYTASISVGAGLSNVLTGINQHTASMLLYTGSANDRFTNIEAATSSYETTGRGIISGSSQITPLLPTGVISSSAQIDTLFNIDGLVSGSSQIIPLLPTGVVSGSSQLLDSSTIHSGSTNNYQFNSIGVGSATAASGVNGEIRAQGDITAYYSSDERLKENIQPIVDALSKVESISGNTYDWKEGFESIHSHTGHDIGVIAQEIEKVLPEVVIDRETGYKAVQYEKIVPLLIEAIKELSAKVKELESK